VKLADNVACDVLAYLVVSVIGAPCEPRRGYEYCWKSSALTLVA
jgi:hypothetical protein